MGQPDLSVFDREFDPLLAFSISFTVAAARPIEWENFPAA